MKNAISIDVEEYFQVTGFDGVIEKDSWDSVPSRLHIGMDRILAILDRYNVKATFFFLGWIAERHPEMVKRVAEGGHEIGIHSYDHTLIYKQTPEKFEEDIARSLAILREHYQGDILGFRAPTFSVVKDTLWALDVLKKLGFKYDSSIFPFRRNRYGIEDAPTKPYTLDNGLVEFPMSTLEVFGKRIPVCGGGYFRLYPYTMTKYAIETLNKKHNQPAMVYLHPWEFDPDQPEVPGSAGNKFRHRVNLNQTEKRLEQLCKDFEFLPIKEILAL